MGWLSRGAAWGLGLLLCCGVAGAQGPFQLPVAVAFDSAGDLFLADAGRHQVFEVANGGAVSVVAGTGAQGFGGDGGAATAALLNAPAGLAVGSDGALYIADTGNQRVRVVRGGMISTVAGSGVRGYSGDGGAASLAAFSRPMGLAFDSSGALLIADSGNHRVRRVAAGVVTTFAGTGVQGFGGDGGAATAAVLDSPQSLTVGGDARVFVADTRNHRIRVIGTDGVIETFAGSGVAGSTGDGGSAVSAKLFAPQGTAAMPSGAVVIADSGNHRVRVVSASGTITTLAGDGVQGAALNAVAATASAIDKPVAVAVSSVGDVVFADAGEATVMVVAADGTLRAVGSGALAATLTLQPAGSLTYGSGSLAAVLVSASPAAEGSVALLDSGQSVSTAALAGDAAVLSTSVLAAGTHSLSAAFGGDLLHGSAVSAALNVVVAPLGITATATDATVTFGAPLPALSGTLTGVLARDATSVAAQFSSTAMDLAVVGTYPISATLTGVASGNYSVTLSAASGALHVVQAQPSVTLVTQGSNAGLPILLSATAVSPTRGVPTGTVQFLDGSNAVASAVLSNGSASAAYLTPPAGSRSLTAMYMGDRNFTVATSAVSSVVASALPDFVITPSGSSTQTVQGGAIASYGLLVTPQPAPFSGSVVLSAAGLQPGAKVVFTPAAVVPGSGSVVVTMSVQTVALAGTVVSPEAGKVRLAMLLFGIVVLAIRRRKLAALCVLCILPLVLSSCGTRTVASSSEKAQTYNVTVTGTSTNLAGSVVTHTCVVTLTVE